MSEPILEPIYLDSIHDAIDYGVTKGYARLNYIASAVVSAAGLYVGYRALRDGFTPEDADNLAVAGGVITGSLIGVSATRHYKNQAKERLNKGLPPDINI